MCQTAPSQIKLVESVRSFTRTSWWNDVRLKWPLKYATATFAFCQKQRTERSHLRENEPAVEFSHEGFEEQKEVLLANLISQKLQEEVALRKKKNKPDPEASRHPWEIWAFLPSSSEPAWRVFQGWGHVSPRTHQTRSPPLCSLYWAWDANTRTYINNTCTWIVL